MRIGNIHSRLGIVWLATIALLVNSLAITISYGGTKTTPYSIPTANNTSTIANLICSGKFATAKELLTKENKTNTADINYLADIVSEYEAIEKKRQVTHANAYHEQIEKLEKFHAEANSGKTNDVTDLLQVIFEASDYATNEQRQLLLEDSFVKQTIEKALIKAEELDANAQWLEAYQQYFWWLERIDQSNEFYSNRARQLLNKAEIKASLQDSPCETFDKRYAGVEPKIFIEAIHTLDADYVVRIIDYRQMAIKAINRCEMLVEVMEESNLEISKSKKMLSLQYKKELKDFSTSLMSIVDEINRSSEVISKEDFINIFEEVLALNVTSAKIAQQALIVQFTKGALSSLDPHTIVIWPNQVSDFEKRMDGKFSGIGVIFSKEKGAWAISSLLPETPAYKSNLNVGDVIKAVDGVDAGKMTSDCMVNKITGPTGTVVTLTVKHPDRDKLSDITIIRANVNISSIRGWQRTKEGKWQYMIDDHNQIGYIRIANFTENTAINFEKVLSRLEMKGLRGLVVDLRSNPGGILNVAAKVVDMFIEKGMIVSTCPRYGMASYISAHKENTRPDCPTVILTNKASASASEIVAGALQDKKYKRATLVGERTYGKGSVQTIKRLSGNAKLKFTMAYYRLPSGQRVGIAKSVKGTPIKNGGIVPNVAVQLNTKEHEDLAHIQKANEALRNNSRNHICDVKFFSSQDTINADPQLAIGLLVLKSKMAQANHTIALK